jgi:hypothetical protein
MPSTSTGPIAKQRNGEGGAGRAKSPDLRKSFDGDFKSVADLMKAANLKIE